MEENFYIVSEKILSEAMKKTVKVKELLRNGVEDQVKGAVKNVGLSRSTYYKYKDYIFPFVDEQSEELVTLSLLALDKAGVLSEVLSEIAKFQGNILTINQDLPLEDVAHVTLTIEINDLVITLDELVNSLNSIVGIRKAKIIMQSFKK
ncbi:MAG: ACT domain-containing protein [Bacillota bacterium]